MSVGDKRAFCDQLHLLIGHWERERHCFTTKKAFAIFLSGNIFTHCNTDTTAWITAFSSTPAGFRFYMLYAWACQGEQCQAQHFEKCFGILPAKCDVI